MAGVKVSGVAVGCARPRGPSQSLGSLQPISLDLGAGPRVCLRMSVSSGVPLLLLSFSHGGRTAGGWGGTHPHALAKHGKMGPSDSGIIVSNFQTDSLRYHKTGNTAKNAIAS